jgi:hypothetical protein
MHRLIKSKATGSPEKALMENVAAMTIPVEGAGREMPVISQKDREVLEIANQLNSWNHEKSYRRI